MVCNMRKAALALLLIFALSLTGCAKSLTHWIVILRNSQGDAALERPSLPEAGTDSSQPS